MKKRTHKTLYPQKEPITLKNILLEDKNLLILLILIISIFIFIIGCLFCIDGFRGEHVYNTIGGV